MSRGKKEHTEVINFRLTKDIKQKMVSRMIKKSSEVNEMYNTSRYLRELIEKDYNNK